MLTNLRRISVIEAVSYLLLIVAAVIKRTGGSEIGVTVMGPVHGLLFLAFAGTILMHFRALGWPLWKAISGIFIGSLPLGGFYLDQMWLKPMER